MDLTPDLLLEAKFAPARRGYDMNEVDDFLERCAEGLDVLLARLRAEFERAERAEAALAEVRSGGTPIAADVADGPLEPVHEPTPEPETVAPVAAPVEPDPARVEEPMRILLAAERTAEAAVADARAEAERIRSEAESVASTTRSEAETLLARARAEAEAEARRAGEEARRSIEAEVLALREDRDVLSADVTNLRRWLDDQRARLRSTAEELQRLVDDPDALRSVPAPEIVPVEDLVTEAAAGSEQDEVVDARTGGDVLGGFDEPLFDEGEPTQAVPRFGDDLDGPGSFFDDERASTGFTSSDIR
ncbi:MAG TPA: DivIVA domain-containing protein [Acidimicrobiales bacterium]|nr:DivIVA domain-containing protein [Acidimicrobiales bacterium]